MMNGTQHSHEMIVGPAANVAPEVLAVLLHDRAVSRQTARSVAARWAATVPTTAFLIPACGDHDVSGSVAYAPVLDGEARRLMPLIIRYLDSYRLDPSRLVLI